MKALVVYDSVFGNTEKVAQAIAEALRPKVAVELHPAGQLTPAQLLGSDLLIVGSPTRGFRPTEAMAALLKGMDSKALRGVRVAAFDTRLKADEMKSAAARFFINTGGYAAKRIANSLKNSGGTLVVPPEGFFVEDTEGPLKPGELERAAEWATKTLSLA
jgi:flavodoxin